MNCNYFLSSTMLPTEIVELIFLYLPYHAAKNLKLDDYFWEQYVKTHFKPKYEALTEHKYKYEYLAKKFTEGYNIFILDYGYEGRVTMMGYGKREGLLLNKQRQIIGVQYLYFKEYKNVIFAPQYEVTYFLSAIIDGFHTYTCPDVYRLYLNNFRYSSKVTYLYNALQYMHESIKILNEKEFTLDMNIWTKDINKLIVN